MNVWDLRRANKSNIRWGSWGSGSMTRTAFPLSRARRRFYRLGSAYTWRVVTFDAGDYQYRLLVAYRTDKEQFSALLGVTDDSEDTKIVARLEFHGTHGGWHIHYASDELESVPSGVRCGPWVKRHDCGGHENFGLSASSSDDANRKAMTIVADVFRLRTEDSMI